MHGAPPEWLESWRRVWKIHFNSDCPDLSTTTPELSWFMTRECLQLFWFWTGSDTAVWAVISPCWSSAAAVSHFYFGYFFKEINLKLCTFAHCDCLSRTTPCRPQLRLCVWTHAANIVMQISNAGLLDSTKDDKRKNSNWVCVFPVPCGFV